MASEQEREALRKAYRSDKWVDKVNAMSDAQVHVIYLRLKAQGKL